MFFDFITCSHCINASIPFFPSINEFSVPLSTMMFYHFHFWLLYSLKFAMSSEFESFWKPFTRVFQAICVSHYSVFRPSVHNSFRKSLPFLIYFTICATAHLALIFTFTSKASRESSHDSVKYKESALMFYINALSIVSNIVIHSTIHLENIFYGKREQQICDKLKLINDIFVTKFDYHADFKARSIKYIRQTVAFYVLIFILTSASTFTPLPDLYDDKFFMPPILILSVIMTQSRSCQIALFLNIIADTLDDLQMLLKQQQTKCFQELAQQMELNVEFENIQYFRKIYSNVWLIVTLMSDCFGWSLIALLAKVVLEFINGSYWFYINLSLHQSISLNIRKFFFSLWKKQLIISFLCFFLQILYWSMDR